MNCLRLPHMDSPVSVFDICQAHQQLEADYNVGGWLRERPSNRRRMEASSVQLSRIGYSEFRRWVDICAERDEDGDPADEDVKDIYLINVLKWGLPIDEEIRAAMANRFTSDFLKSFPHWRME